MVNMEGELIVVTIISSIFGLCGLLILDRNWFRRENFKIAKKNTEAYNKLQIEKMRRELGLTKTPTAATAAPGGMNDLLGMAKGLGKDKVLDLIDKFMPDEESDEDQESDDTVSKILKYVPPEVIQNALKGVMGSKEGGDGGTVYNE
jgi:hypothetical protein